MTACRVIFLVSWSCLAACLVMAFLSSLEAEDILDLLSGLKGLVLGIVFTDGA